MIASAADADTLPHERARNYDEKEMLWPVDVQWEEEDAKARTREITAEILQKRLEECVEKIDNEEALEFSMQQNKDGFKQDVFLNLFSSLRTSTNQSFVRGKRLRSIVEEGATDCLIILRKVRRENYIFSYYLDR